MNKKDLTQFINDYFHGLTDQQGEKVMEHCEDNFKGNEEVISKGIIDALDSIDVDNVVNNILSTQPQVDTKPTVQRVEELTKETLRFELGSLMDTIIDNVFYLLEEDKDFNPKNLSTKDGDTICEVIMDTVRSEIHNADDLI